MSKGYLQFQAPQLSVLPIRCIAFTTAASDREQAVSQAQTLYTAQDHAVLLNFTADHLVAEPEQADVVHDLMAYLAEQMIDMNKQKQATVGDFWLDLEGITDAANFETLRDKGKHERTLWKRAPACRPFVSQESHATRRLNESLGWNEDAFKAFVKVLAGKVQNLTDVVAVYRKYHPAYRDLVARIQATDRLIDQIVYKLYGLTEEEIAIVEGTNN